MYNEAEVEVKVRIEKIMEGQNQQQIEIKLQKNLMKVLKKASNLRSNQTYKIQKQ